MATDRKKYVVTMEVTVRRRNPDWAPIPGTHHGDDLSEFGTTRITRVELPAEPVVVAEAAAR